MTRGRVLARKRWQAIANGEFDRATLLWIANTAGAILRADDTEVDRDRPGAVLEATGLAGRNDPERDAIRSIVDGVDHTCMLIERGSRWAPARSLKRGERNKLRREAVAGALGIEETPAAIDKRIKRALAN